MKSKRKPMRTPDELWEALTLFREGSEAFLQMDMEPPPMYLASIDALRWMTGDENTKMFEAVSNLRNMKETWEASRGGS